MEEKARTQTEEVAVPQKPVGEWPYRFISQAEARRLRNPQLLGAIEAARAKYYKGTPVLAGARLARTLKTCPPKTYRKAVA